MSTVEDDGAIHVEGELLGRLQGLSFVPEAAFATPEARLLKAAATQALTQEIAARARALSMTGDPELKLTRLGQLIWQHHPVGRLVPGDAQFRPRIEIIADDTLQAQDRDLVRDRLEKFVARQIESLVGPLVRLEESDGLEGMARGLAFRLAENFGILPRDQVSGEVKALSQDDRAKLRTHGVRFGAFTIFLPLLLKPAASELRLLLWTLKAQKPAEDSPPLPPNGLTSMAVDAARSPDYYRVCGFRMCGARAVRVDMLERLADLIRDRVFWKPRFPEEKRPEGSVEGGGFVVTPDLMSLVGCSGEEFDRILESLGFRFQMRQVVKPAPAPEAPPVIPPVASVALPENAAADAPMPEAVMPDVGPPETVPAPAAGEPPETPVESGVEQAAVPSSSDESVAGLAAPAPAPVETKVWWPKDTGPFRRELRQAQHQRKPHNTRARDGTAADGGKDGHRSQRHGKGRQEQPRNHDRHDNQAAADGGQPNRNHKRPEKPQRQKFDKPMDPNSPFAVLQSLKAQMKDRQS